MHTVIVEHAYNILDALRRYVDDADCELFLKVLEGNLCEQAFYDQVCLFVPPPVSVSVSVAVAAVVCP